MSNTYRPPPEARCDTCKYVIEKGDGGLECSLTDGGIVLSGKTDGHCRIEHDRVHAAGACGEWRKG